MAETNPKKGIKIPNATNAANRVKTRVVKLSLTNLIFIGVTFFAGLILLNSYNQPSLGVEVSIDQFLRNIEQNKYSSVDIRNDGNAVGREKYVEVLSTETQDNLSTSTSRPAEVAEINFNTGNQEYIDRGSFEQKTIQDLINVLKPASSISEIIAQLRDGGTRGEISEIYILDSGVVVEWQGATDWLIPDITEMSLNAELRANNLDVASLPVEVSILRYAATIVTPTDFQLAIGNDRYTKVWQTETGYFARVNEINLAQNYVGFGSVTNDFTRLLEGNGIDLANPNVRIRALPISQIDFASVINLILIAGLLATGFFLIRSMNGSSGGLMKFGQSKARMFFGQKMNITFKDVAGVNEAKQELQEVVDFLKHPQKYIKIGAKIPRGVLMVGEPGTGKTLLARAIAGEAGVPFFHTSGSEFEEMLVGAGASRVRDLFDKAKKASPALIFIDEIDAVGRKRGTTIQSSSTEQTLNQILVEMDGFESRDNVIVIAATNRPDVLDPALLRPGRFDRKVVLDQPDIEGRKAILTIHAKNKPLASEVDLLQVAKRTVGFSGADLANMLNEAAIIVAKENRKELTMADIEEAATKVQTGPIRRRKRSKEELKMTAYHEAAHALVMKMTPQSDPVYRITILSRGMALGYTMPLPETDQLQMTKTKMISKIKSLLAGFIAEETIFNDVTTGASNDIERATGIARQMVKRFGMSKKLGLVRYGDTDEESVMGYGYSNKNYSEATAEIIDDEVRSIINEAYEAAKKIIVENRKVLDEIAEKLLKDEVIEADVFLDFFSKIKKAKGAIAEK